LAEVKDHLDDKKIERNELKMKQEVSLQRQLGVKGLTGAL
jgi:hypothetical protein